MLSGGKLVDISLELDPKNFGMRTPAGNFKFVRRTWRMPGKRWSATKTG